MLRARTAGRREAQAGGLSPWEMKSADLLVLLRSGTWTRGRMIHWALVVGLILLMPTVVYASEGFSPWGRQVLSIKIQSDAQLTLRDFSPQLIAQKIATPLDRSEVSQTLKNLYATGRFISLRADVESRGGGVDLILAGKAQYFTGMVRVRETGKVLAPDALASGARLNLGHALSPEELAAGRLRIRSLLTAEGYYRSQVGFTVTRNPADQVADVTFSVVAGPPAVLSGVKFAGRAVIPPARLALLAGWKRGTHLTSAKITHGLSEIHSALAKRGYWAAATSVERRVYNPGKNTELLQVAVNQGPLVLVHIEGAHISSSELKRALPVFQEGLTDDLSLDEGAHQLQGYLERRGFFSAKARWRRIPHPNEMDITYTIDLGPQSTFDGYDFRGNLVMTSAELKPLITIQPAAFPLRPHGVFSEQMLNHDVNAIEGYYQSKGFLSARVTSRRLRKPGVLSVVFEITEGPRTMVGSIAIKGVDTTTQEQLLAVLQALPGRPYSPATIAKDRDSMLTYFANHGYDQAHVTSHVSPPVRYKVNIEYQAVPGPEETIARVVILGNHYARTGLIQHALTFQAGQPLSQVQLYSSQRHLYSLGLFNSVDISPENPGGAQTAKTILVNVVEAERWTLGYGFGVDAQRLNGNQPAGQLGVSPRLSLDLTRINVDGRNQTFSVRGRLSDLETGGEASYVIPDILAHPSLSLHFDTLVDQTRDVLTFTSTIEQASVTLEKQFTPSTFLLGQYVYRYVTVSDLKIDPLEVPLLSQPVRDAGFEATFVHDTRDNASDATRGSYSLLDASISSIALGSQANFTRFLGQNSTYHHLLGTRLIFARSTQFGVESTYGALEKVIVSGQTEYTNQIPLAERFFAGGSDSLRAFSLNQAGPRDPATGYPIGGNALFANSFELRMRLRGGHYGLVLFNDTGNVFSNIQDLDLLRFSQPSLSDLNYMVDAVGVGVRYRTPVGPIRLDLSWVPNPSQFQYTQPPEVQTLPRFQYFISIGQSF